VVATAGVAATDAAACGGAAGSGPLAGQTLVTLSFDRVTQGASRLEACRWFYESLVLANKGYVKLSQPVPYADITIATATS
jgi:chromatin segregation and condensation protein Rec8/ScpA/Scc1 (kleisin family)